MLDTGYRIEGFKNLEDRGRLKGGKKNKTDTRGWRPPLLSCRKQDAGASIGGKQ